MLLRCSFDFKKLNIHAPQFFINILNSYAEINSNDKAIIDTAEEICNQVIWNNSHILINGKSVFYQQFFDDGTVKIGDLFDNNGINHSMH